MTEQEWRACGDPDEMLHFLHGKASARKLHLFTAACHRLNWDYYPEVYHQLIEAEERFADGLASAADIYGILQQVGIYNEDDDMEVGFLNDHHRWACGYAYDSAKDGAYWTAKDDSEESWAIAYDALRSTQCCRLREIVGNPFRPLSVDPSWLSNTVRSLAQAVYDDRGFDRMPILGDALEEAGCTNGEILAHCRGPGPHVRGCWVVDLLLGKE